MAEKLLEMRSIGKSFPGVRALDDVSLEVDRGTIHGLLGENGAGKSTLMKILSGAYRPDEGEILFEGAPIQIHNPHQAQRLGIATIYQEFNLVPSLTIAENVFIGREPGITGFVDWAAMRRATRNLTDRLGIDLDPMTAVRSLMVAEQQMVEIAKALSMDSKLIIMDEPTSALSSQEVEHLFDIMRDLKAQGISVIFITHRLEEVLRICDRITVLRDGRNVGVRDIADVTVDDMIRMMVGRSADELFQRKAREKQKQEVALRVEGLSRKGTSSDPNATVLANISFEVYRGEILGIAGLVGAGRTELARAIFGADAFSGGHIEMDNRPVKINSPRDAIRHGIGLVPEDRKRQALFLAMGVRENATIAILNRLSRWKMFIDRSAEMEMVETYRKALDIRMASPEQRVNNLSGGNQQKVVIARWLALQPKILIVDEPTRGIDVAAKSEVHALLDTMAQNGVGIVIISSELPEILAMSDRILTMREGHLTGIIARENANEEVLMRMMTVSNGNIA